MSKTREAVVRSSAGWKPGVEPLSQRAWDRVEARVFERIERGELLRAPAPLPPRLPKLPLWLSAAAVLTAASVLSWWRFAPAPQPLAQLEQVTQNAPVAPPAMATPAATALASSSTTRIVTTIAPTETSIGEAEVTLAARSDVSFSGTDALGWLVQLARGQVDCHVPPRRGRPAFVVQAGATRVSVVGTRFSVSRDGEAVAVSVREGHVRVQSGALEVLLGPGERWPAPVASAEHSPLRRPPASPPSRGAKGKRAAARDGERERFERAARLEASNPDAALELYAALAQNRGPWSANALYARARLEFERGAFAKAKPLLSRYLRRYPRGANAEDVRQLLSKLE